MIQHHVPFAGTARFIVDSTTAKQKPSALVGSANDDTEDMRPLGISLPNSEQRVIHVFVASTVLRGEIARAQRQMLYAWHPSGRALVPEATLRLGSVQMLHLGE